MSVTLSDVEKIANLAKLEFSSQEKEKFVQQFNQILQYMEKLNELDTAEVKPTAHVLELKNVTREDAVSEWLSQEEALENAPRKNAGHFSVPKVIG